MGLGLIKKEVDHKVHFLFYFLELTTGFEPVTSTLPM